MHLSFINKAYFVDFLPDKLGFIHTFILFMDSKKQKPDTETERQTEKDTIGIAPTVFETHIYVGLALSNP